MNSDEHRHLKETCVPVDPNAPNTTSLDGVMTAVYAFLCLMVSGDKKEVARGMVCDVRHVIEDVLDGKP